MSYDNSSGSSWLSRTLGPGGISMFWVKMLSYAPALNAVFEVNGTLANWLLGMGFNSTPSTALTAIAPNSGNTQAIATGSNTNWVYCCMAANFGVGLDVYWRFEGASVLQHALVVDTAIEDAANYPSMMNDSSFQLNVHQRLTAYKEWSSGSLTAAQILAESAQVAPIVNTGLTNYLSCQVGSTVGQDLSGTGHNWTVTGTITLNADEPNMALPSAGVGFNPIGIHYVTP